MRRLVEPQPKNLKKVAVKIRCFDESYVKEGSGFITGVGDDRFVITCAHCIKKESGDIFQSSKIGISIVYNSKNYELKVKSINFDDSELMDYAILTIELPSEIQFNYSDYVRFLKDDVGRVASLYGYQEGADKAKLQPFSWQSETTWVFNGPPIANQEVDASAYWQGFSGSGLFCQEEGTDILYAIAYFKGIVDKIGNYNECKCYPISNVCNKLHGKPLEEVPVENIEIQVEKEVVLGTEHFKTLKDGLLRDKQDYPFEPFEFANKIIDILRDDDEMVIQIIGLSGLGKTRLLYEAFNTNTDIQNAYYCKYDKGDIETELTNILIKHHNETGIIIIDDCPWKIFPDYVSLVNRKNDQFRLISTNHDFFDAPRTEKWRQIEIFPSDLETEVNKYIDEILKPKDNTKSAIDDIKKISEGYPGMAMELVKLYQEGVPASVDTVEYLMPKLLNFDSDPTQQRKQSTLMQTIALCQPMPYLNQQRIAFEYMIKSDNFTPLYNDVHIDERIDIVESLVKKYKPTLIEIQSEWLNVRPFPLAVWLTKKWFEKCPKTRFAQLIDEIQKQEESVQKIVSEGFCKHIEQMHGNKEAFELVQSLVDPKEGDSPFLNEEVLCSGLGSRFFLAMSAVNPAAIAFCLSSLILPKSKEWLMDNLSEEARRNIVWGLEKMCFARESYKDAFKVLAKLAVSENEEHFSNNATGQLRQLFHIHLSGTEASLEERIELLDYLINAGPEYSTIAVNCIASALDNGGFARMGGSEKFGMERKTDYMPKTYGEIFTYWRNCRDMLIKCVEADPLNIETVSHIVETHTYRWIVERRTDILIPLLEYISARKNNRWDAEYEQLCKSRRMNKTAPSISEDDDIQQWINKLRPRLFLSDLKDLRYELWDNYHTNADYSFEESKRLFEPLADKFVSTKVYSIKEEMSALLDDRDHIDAVFPILIKEKMDEDASIVMFDTIFEIVKEKGDNYNSSLLHSICIRFIGEKSLEDFLVKIKDASMLTLYIQLMTFTEDEGLSHLKKLSKMEKSGKIKDFLPTYLCNFQSLKKDLYELMINTVYELYPSEGLTILNTIIRKQFFYNPTTESNLLPLIKKLSINCDIESDNAINLIDYTRFLEELLHNVKDDDFARAINKKFIAYHQSQLRINDCKEIFKVLIKEYTSVVWDDFMDAFLAEDGFLFAWQVKDVIGSGFGFGAGPLFQIDNWELKLQDLCMKYPDTAPYRIAETAPCYSYGRTENGQHVIGFSDIIMWLLDNFGKDQKVRDGIHSNIGNFSWTGSVIPYYEDNIACFKQLENHKISEVKEWVVLCIKEFELQMEAEKSKEDYLRIHYGV